MDKTINFIDGFLLTVGSAYSVANIKEVLGVVILVIQLLWLLAKLLIRIYTAIENKEPIDDVSEDVEDIVENITNIKDFINPEGDDVNADDTES